MGLGCRFGVGVEAECTGEVDPLDHVVLRNNHSNIIHSLLTQQASCAILNCLCGCFYSRVAHDLS